MDATTLRNDLQDAIENAGWDDLRRVVTFGEAGLLTRDEGLVLKFEDGTEFEVTITPR